MSLESSNHWKHKRRFRSDISDDMLHRIHDLVERENECGDLFKEIKNGNGENFLRYLALRDSCKELRREIFRSALLAGLTREKIKKEMAQARNQTATAPNAKQPKKNG